MPTIAIVDGVRIVIYLNDHEPPHIHAFFAEYEARISIATSGMLSGTLPSGKRKRVLSWLAEHREEVSYLWIEIEQGRYQGGMIK